MKVQKIESSEEIYSYIFEADRRSNAYQSLFNDNILEVSMIGSKVAGDVYQLVTLT